MAKKLVNYGYDNVLKVFSPAEQIEQVTSLSMDTSLETLDVYFNENKGKKTTFPKSRDVKITFTALRATDKETPLVQDKLADLAFSMDASELMIPVQVDLLNGKYLKGTGLVSISNFGFGDTEAETYLEGEITFSGDWEYTDTI